MASLLSDDPGYEIHAFDLSGRPVRLSLDEPPDIPVLALVPAEIDFDSGPARRFVDSRHLPIGGGLLGATAILAPFVSGTAVLPSYSGGDGLYATALTLYDLHEPWILSDPEIEIHPAIHDDGDDVMYWLRCAGAEAASPFYFDQNDHYWYGEVKVAHEANVAGRTVEFHIWEDDHDPCLGFNGRIPYTSANLISSLIALQDIFAAEIVGDTISGIWSSIYAAKDVGKELYDFASGLNNDDYVGVFKAIPAECYLASSGPIWYALQKENGSEAGWGRMDNTNDVSRELCDPESLDPIEVTLNGPTQIPPSASEGCGYSAVTSGGGYSYLYNWKWDGETLPGEELDAWVPSGGLSPGYVNVGMKCPTFVGDNVSPGWGRTDYV